MSYTKDEIGAILKKLRVKAGLTQKEAAERLGRRQQIIGHWETGYSQPDANTLFALCDLYNTSVNDAFGFSSHKSSLSKKAYIIGQLYDKADDHAREIVDITLKPFDDGTLKKGTAHRDNLEIAAELTPVFTRPIPLHRLPVSAGTGEFLDSDDFDIIEVGSETPASATFGVRISGDSMEPAYPNGYVAWVKRAVRIDEGQVGVFVLNGDGFIKKLGRNCLLSLNPDYQPITLNEEDELRTYGIVVGVSENVY